ncbi:hypothetical protein AND_007643 [Anopheles darlingi]|uniref:Receptor-binding cancer antigen n=1 Tax=Anopheles darlingi TaxID=43151 RepID=W5J8E3_ANODA|nr:receptor-binding cancer antigen expressed on SiSo cells [Anopheles darlingi]ETN60727.1 hypothetical protein AND_007643 [Anopheles darlingi]
MIAELIMNRMRQLLLALIGVLKRAMCCFSLRRHHTNSEYEALNSISVDPSAGSAGRVLNAGSVRPKHLSEKDWNTWDDTPSTVEEHIERYRETLAQPPPVSEAPPEVDYFQDMTPHIRAQPKICIAEETEPRDFSRLTAKIDIPVMNELEDWNEDDRTGWDEADEVTTKQLIRETRKERRAQRYQDRHHQVA